MMKYIEDELNLLEQNDLKRNPRIIKSESGPWVELEDGKNGKKVLQLGSNNYLGLANHPDLIQASHNAMVKYGVGSTGSRLLTGTTILHHELEMEIAKFESSEASIFFSSGYSANLGVLSSLIDKNYAVYSDELNHASIIDGIRLSGATKFIYNHNNVRHLENLVSENCKNFKRNFIVTDTVFSMDGDIAPLKEIAEISKNYNCIPVLDEAHATGVFGKNGCGVVEELNLEEYFPIRIGTCSKALGVEGGFCVAPKVVIDLLKNKARSFMFSTSPSPAIVGAVLKSIELISKNKSKKEKLWHNAKYLFNGLVQNKYLRLNEFKTPIIVIYFNSINEVLKFSDFLFDECHIWAPAIRPPTVKVPRIRLTPMSTHSEEDMDIVINAFRAFSVECLEEQRT